MTKEEVIKFWKTQLDYKYLMSPSMVYIIENTLNYLEEV